MLMRADSVVLVCKSHFIYVEVAVVTSQATPSTVTVFLDFVVENPAPVMVRELPPVKTVCGLTAVTLARIVCS